MRRFRVPVKANQARVKTRWRLILRHYWTLVGRIADEMRWYDMSDTVIMIVMWNRNTARLTDVHQQSSLPFGRVVGGSSRCPYEERSRVVRSASRSTHGAVNIKVILVDAVDGECGSTSEKTTGRPSTRSSAMIIGRRLAPALGTPIAERRLSLVMVDRCRRTSTCIIQRAAFLS